jgi:hypothetical protein
MMIGVYAIVTKMEQLNYVNLAVSAKDGTAAGSTQAVKAIASAVFIVNRSLLSEVVEFGPAAEGACFILSQHWRWMCCSLIIRIT